MTLKEFLKSISYILASGFPARIYSIHNHSVVGFIINSKELIPENVYEYKYISMKIEANLIINGGEIVSKTIGIYSTTGNTEITGGTIDADNPLVVNSETTTVKGGTFEGASEAVYVNGTATVTIKGGFFTSDIPNYTVNKIDSVIDSATITITGGTYVNFNPSDNTADGEGTNYVSEGYTVTSEVKEDGTYYTVNS
ncbi:MAG: hypothetical protein ACI4RV_06520 [Eubacteriales bacterium]